MNNESLRIKRARFDETIFKIHGDSVTIRDSSSHAPQYEYKDLNWDEDNETFTHHTEDPVDANGHAIFNQPFYDILINAEVNLRKDNKMTNAKVIGRVISEDWLIHGDYNEDPLKHTIRYDVEFDDGTSRQYLANIIATNIID